MLIYLFLLFTILPALELVILIKVGSIIGVTKTLLMLLFTGITGASLARIQGFHVLRKIQENLHRGIMPSEELLDGLMIFMGGIVLLTPGFVTDLFGFFLLIPWTRQVIKHVVKKKFASLLKGGNTFTAWGHHKKNSGEFRRFHPPGNDFDDIDIN